MSQMFQISKSANSPEFLNNVDLMMSQPGEHQQTLMLMEIARSLDLIAERLKP